MFHRRYAISAWTAVCWAVAVPLWAQSTLAGVVYYPDGAVVVGAVVLVTNEVTGVEATRTTNRSGLYVVRDLPAGPYRTTVHVPPYKRAVVRLMLPPHEKKWQFIDLKIETAEEITVRSESGPALFDREASLATTFSREQIENVFVIGGRTVQSLLTLVPGIVVTESVGTLAQFTTMGQRRFANRLTIDGVSADLAVDLGGEGIGIAGSGALPAVATTGGTQTLVPFGALEEIQIRTTNASPAHARTPGAQTEVTTRAGSDRFMGTGFLEARVPSLAATDWFTNTHGTPERRVEHSTGGVSVGGPIVTKRLLSFGAWERQAVDRSINQTIRVPSLGVRAAASSDIAAQILNAFPQPNGRELANNLAERHQLIPIVSSLSTLSVRLDGYFSRRHRVFARLNNGRSTGDALFDSRNPFWSFMNTETTSTHTSTAGWTTLLASATHDLRVNSTTHRGSLVPSTASYGDARPFGLDALVVPGTADDAGVRLNVFPGPGGFLLIGRAGESSQEQCQVVDTWAFLNGRHEWRMGVDYRRVFAATTPASDRYTYQFDSITNVLQGRVRFITIHHLEAARVRLESWAFFAQDSWRVTPRLTVNYGLRYSINPAPRSTTATQPLLFEYEALPQSVSSLPMGVALWRTSFGNVAPRLGAAYQVSTKSGRETTVHASWSRVYDELTSPGAVAFGNSYPYLSTRELRPSAFPVPPEEWAPTTLPSFEASPFAEAYAFPRRLRSPHTDEFHLGLDRALGSGQRLSVAYVGNVGRKLIYPHTHYLDPNHPIRAFSNDGTSEYHALFLEHTRRLSRSFESRASYTWSHAIDLDSGETAGPTPPPSSVPPLSNRGNADFDRRHVLRGGATYWLPAVAGPKLARLAFDGWQMDMVGVVMSGAPVSVTFAQDFGAGAFYFVRPDVVPDVPIWITDTASPAGRRINRDAFRRQSEARQGTLGRNALRASGLRQVDLALSRSLRLTDRSDLRVRIEAFNVFNIPNFGPPRSGLTLTDFGTPDLTYAEALGTGTLMRGGLVPTQQSGGPRAIQVGIRLRW